MSPYSADVVPPSRIRWLANLSRIHSIPILTSPDAKDGAVYQFGGPSGQRFVIGTRPWTQREIGREQATRIVRHGLADVLAWLGEDPGPSPDDPYPVVGGLEVIRRIRHAGGYPWPW